ncbi:hypothetical protein BBJ28_00005444 [Nothophytophthora sp. Chile5]|nr:hypothetical protein BBJ28_00005444 [Nothophytophthora sp. Chile5]
MQPHVAGEARLSRASSWPIAQAAALQDAAALLSPSASLEDASLPVGGQATQQQQRRPRGDTSMDFFLAFVDSFPLRGDHLLLDGAKGSDRDTSGEVELLSSFGASEDVGSATESSTTPTSEPSRDQQRREASRKKDHNKYLRKKVSFRMINVFTLHLSKCLLSDSECYLVQARVSDLQTQATALRRRLADLEALSDGGTSFPVDLSGYEGATKRETTQWKLLRISQEKDKLQAENAQLHKHFHRSIALSGKLRGMLNAEHKLYLSHSSYFAVLKPLTPPDCQRELKQSMASISESYTAAGKLGCCREIYGWDEKRLTRRAEFHNWKRKTLRFKSARFVFGQTWEIFANPFRTEKLFSSAMGARCRLVQRVDDDNLLLCYDYASSSMLAQKSEAPEVTTMALVTRVSTSTGHFIVTRGLCQGSVEVQDRLKAKPIDERRPAWLKTLTWYAALAVGSAAFTRIKRVDCFYVV